MGTLDDSTTIVCAHIHALHDIGSDITYIRSLGPEGILRSKQESILSLNQ